MWKWLNRRRSRHRNENTTTLEGTATNADNPSSSDDSSRLQGFFFKPSVPIPAIPPKCLSCFTFSDILYGERIEDFSPECWLEDHLHQFGLPTNQRQFTLRSNTNEGILFQSRLVENNDDSSTGSSENDSSLIDYSDIDTEPDITMPVHVSRPRLALEDLFTPMPDIEAELNSSEYGDIILENPPPYSEYDLPPSYEEAVGQFERRSGGTRSSQGSSLAFMW